MNIIPGLLVLLIAAVSVSAQFQSLVPNAVSLNDAAGREFWIAIPPNEVESHPREALEIHLVSTSSSIVRVTDFYTGVIKTYALDENENRILSDVRGDISWSSEIRDAEVAIPKALHIESTSPITVYVLNSKQYSHDGYRAIPTHAWGLEYVPVSYYDFKEFASWAGGFVIIAAEPTTIDLQLRGVGDAAATTSMGRRINTKQTQTVLLDSGEVFMVHGDGTTRGLFDISGSLIRSDRPIGVLAFHMKTSMPNLLTVGGRQHLVEMCQPVSTWGRRSVTLDFTRIQAKGPGSGDVFRVVTNEPSTKWSVTSYSRQAKQILSKDGGNLLKAGDFADISQSVSPTSLIGGISIWESSQPTRVIQYATSWTWDYNMNLDPIMVEVPSLDAAVSYATFPTSNNPRFGLHHLSLIVRADPSSATYNTDLESLSLDNVPLWSHPLARLPGLKSTHLVDGIHFVTVEVPSDGKIHVLRANNRLSFIGNLVGSGVDEAYGWPVAGSIRPAAQMDTTSPIVRIDTRDCRFATITLEDRGHGIAWIDTVAGKSSNNIELDLPSKLPLSRFNPVNSCEFSIVVRDRKKPAKCVFYVQDWADNISIDSVRFEPIVDGDTFPPSITTSQTSNSTWDVVVTELRNSKDATQPCPESPVQIESGLKSFSLKHRSDSNNITLQLERVISQDSLKPTTRMKASVQVVNVWNDARAVYQAVDWSGNVSIDSIRYDAPTSIIDDLSYQVSLLHCHDGVLKLSLATNTVYERIELYDTSGQMVATEQDVSPNTQLNLEGLSAGFYIAHLITGNKVVTRACLCVSQ